MDNIPAFPETYLQYVEGVETVDYQKGMTLRDYFAGQVLSGMCVRKIHAPPDNYAEVAYQIADAMLKARENHD